MSHIMNKTKIYSLVYLDYNLKQLGIAGKCFKYELSGAKDCLHIVYLDSYLQEQFIVVFRTSRLCYRIYHNGNLITRRSCKLATVCVSDILTDIISLNDYYNVMTVSELNKLQAITYNKKLELFRRKDTQKK